MASVAQIGGFTHADNEINLVSVSYRTRYSPRNKKLTKTVTMSLFGQLLGATTTAINDRANTVYNAYQQDYKDFRYTVGGILCHQLLNSADCVSGVKVLAHSFPRGDGSELCTERSFSATLQATYDTAETDLVAWTESIETIGTGGAKFFVVDTAFGPIAIYTSIASAQYYVQTGQAVGYKNYPEPPGPCNPAGEFQDRRRITRIGGRNMGNDQLRFFTRKWSYFMGRDISQFGSADFVPISQ